jgi:hypothetical protein
MEEIRRGSLSIRISPERTVMRGPMFPNLSRFRDGSILLSAASAEEHSESVTIRSADGGQRWTRWAAPVEATARHAALELAGGRTVAFSHRTSPVDGRAGVFRMTRWESPDRWKTVRGPLTDGTLRWTEGATGANANPIFYGNVMELAPGRLIASLQGRGPETSFRCFVARSEDGGASWDYTGTVASLATIDDPAGVTRQGWQLHGPCEPALVALGGERFLCVMRLVNDDEQAPHAPPADSYSNLDHDAPGDGIYPGNTFGADQWISPGPRSVPLIAATSEDGGRTWSAARPIVPGVGCYPRIAVSESLLAMTYGALTYPRWGNALTFSEDGGRTWCDEISFAPYLTTGYPDIVCTGPGKFLVVFDSTPPQPWKDHAAHRVGVVDVEVRSPR